ncbi:MAG: hypothetical protein JXB13_20230 [Phycisphaerae bacterium]|nr:hypothetical protein [Phycisphaerae bacterium]
MGETLRVVILRRWAFFVPFCVVATLAALISHQIPRKYGVSTAFERRDNPVLQNLPAGGAIKLVKDSRPTVTRDLRDITLMEDVLDDIGLTASLPRTAEGELTPEGQRARRSMAGRYAAGVSVDVKSFASETSFDNMTISCDGQDPSHLAEVCNALRDRYIAQTRVKMTQRLTETREYFAEQAAACQARIAELNRARLGSVLNSSLADLADPQSVANRLQRLRNERDTLLRERDDLEIRIEAHEDNLSRLGQLAGRGSGGAAGSGTPVLYRSPQAVRIQTEIEEVDAQIYRERQENKKTARHPDVAELLRRRAVLLERLSRQAEVDALTAVVAPGIESSSVPMTSTGSDTVLAQISNLKMELKTLRSQLQRTERSLEVVEADVKDFEARKSEVFENFQAREDVTDALKTAQQEHILYQVTLSKLDTLLTADESERAVGFTVLSPARAALVPSSPKPNIVLMIALLLGIISGACGVLLAEIFDRSFHTTRQVTRSLGLSVLECIDEIVTAADRARQFRRRVLLAPVVVLIMLAAVSGSNVMAYLSLKRPHTYQSLMRVPEQAWGQVAGLWQSPGPSQAGADEPAEIHPRVVPAGDVRLASRPDIASDDLLFQGMLDSSLRPPFPLEPFRPLPPAFRPERSE